MTTPDPTEARRGLARLVGTWRGEETMPPSEWAPEGFTAEGETVGREALGGFAVVVDYRQTHGGQVTYEGHGVYTWEADPGEVVLHWFDGMGGGREEFRGTWDGDVLTLDASGPAGHRRLVYDHGRAGTLASRMEMGPSADALRTAFEGSYERVEGS